MVSVLEKGKDTRTRSLILDQFTPYRIVALGHALSDRLARAYQNENITIPEWRVLAVVAQEPAIAARDVVSRTPMDKMTVSRAIASLEAKGYTQRNVSDRDRRVNEVSLTPSGRQLFDRVGKASLSIEDEMLSVLSADERSVLNSVLTKLTAKTREG